MKINVRTGIGLVSAILLTACGGGGSSSDAQTSQVQKNFEASASGSGYSTFIWYVPSTNVAPTSGTHYFLEDNYSLAMSPSGGPTDLNYRRTNLTNTMAMPDLGTISVNRVLKNGKIYYRNISSPITIAYVNGIVQSRHMDQTKSQILWSTDFDEYSEPVTLVGQINASTILKSYFSFSALATPVNFDLTKSWLAGASYTVRKRKYTNDVVYVYDWTGKTYDDQPTPWSGTEKTIEEYFNNPSLVSAGGVTFDGLIYSYNAGSIVQAEGARIWVSKTKRPTSASPTDSYFSLVDLNGKIYSSTIIKSGTRDRLIDAVDRTVVHEDSVRFNAAAVESIRQTIRF